MVGHRATGGLASATENHPCSRAGSSDVAVEAPGSRVGLRPGLGRDERVTNGREPAFDALVRDALDSSGQDFVVFPCPDGAAGYRAVYVIPLE